MQGTPKQTHTLMDWINAVIYIVWSNAGELPDTVSKWHTYATLTQVVRELGMKQSIFSKYPRPNDEHFTGGIQRSHFEQVHPSTYFGPLTSILVPYVGNPIYEVTLMVA